MSASNAIAAVTSALKSLLQDAIAPRGGRVTTSPPDKARKGSIDQLNLFLYRTAIDAAWRNQPPLPVAGGDGEPALPLVLSYVITAYGQDDDEVGAHGLLGIAMSTFHDNPILSPRLLAAQLPDTRLDEQVEHIRVTPHPIPMDELSRLWTTFQTGYRISATYDVAVVLIDSTRPLVAAPPVLRRGSKDTGPTVSPSVAAPGAPAVTVTGARPPAGLPSVAGGEILTITGDNLTGTTRAVVSGLRLTTPASLAVKTATGTTVELQLPSGGQEQELSPGSYLVSVVTPTATSTAVPFAVRPVLTDASPIRRKIPATGTVRLTVTCQTPLRKDQTVRILVGSRVLEPSSVTDGKITAALPAATAGTYPLRLSVDLVDSLLLGGATSPAFHELVLT